MPRSRQARKPLSTLLALAVLLGLTTLASSSSAALTKQRDCPTIMRIEEVKPGMIATGYTVTQGREPEEFKVKILGVLDDQAFGPDFDTIIADLIIDENSSPTIKKIRRLWAGASGSPSRQVFPCRRSVGSFGAPCCQWAFPGFPSAECKSSKAPCKRTTCRSS